jgi:hypothetical protein
MQRAGQRLTTLLQGGSRRSQHLIVLRVRPGRHIQLARDRPRPSRLRWGCLPQGRPPFSVLLPCGLDNLTTPGRRGQPLSQGSARSQAETRGIYVLPPASRSQTSATAGLPSAPRTRGRHQHQEPRRHSPHGRPRALCGTRRSRTRGRPPTYRAARPVGPPAAPRPPGPAPSAAGSSSRPSPAPST